MSAQKVVEPGDVTWKQRVNSYDGNWNLKTTGTWLPKERCRWISDSCQHYNWLNSKYFSVLLLFTYLQSLRQYKESHNETEILMSALSAMQDKNAHLENSLSAETRIKLDLFSALGEAKRQLEIRESKLYHILFTLIFWILYLFASYDVMNMKLIEISNLWSFFFIMRMTHWNQW